MKRRPRKLLKLGFLILAGAIVNVAVAWGCALWAIGPAKYGAIATTVVDYELRTVGTQTGLWALTKDVRGFGLRVREYERVDVSTVLEDFTHYALIAQSDLASKTAEAAVMYSSDNELRKFMNDRRYKRLQAALERAELLVSVRPVALRLKARFAAIESQVADPLNIGEAVEPVGTVRRIVGSGWPLTTLEGAEVTGSPVLSPLRESHTIGAAKLFDGIPRGAAGKTRLVPLLAIFPGFAINTIFYATILWLLFAAPAFLRRRMRLKRGLCPACAYPIGTSATCTECGNVL